MTICFLLLVVAIQVCAVAIDVSGTSKIYILPEYKYCLHLSLCGAGEMFVFANGKTMYSLRIPIGFTR